MNHYKLENGAKCFSSLIFVRFDFYWDDIANVKIETHRKVYKVTDKTFFEVTSENGYIYF